MQVHTFSCHLQLVRLLPRDLLYSVLIGFWFWFLFFFFGLQGDIGKYKGKIVSFWLIRQEGVGGGICPQKNVSLLAMWLAFWPPLQSLVGRG
jgi:hypothetical protein